MDACFEQVNAESVFLVWEHMKGMGCKGWQGISLLEAFSLPLNLEMISQLHQRIKANGIYLFKQNKHLLAYIEENLETCKGLSFSELVSSIGSMLVELGVVQQRMNLLLCWRISYDN